MSKILRTLRNIKHWETKDKLIYKLLTFFIKPFHEHIEGSGINTFDLFFGAEHREIKFYRLIKPIKGLHGLHKRLALNFDSQSGLRTFAADCWYLGVVVDKRTPHFIDIEFFKDWNSNKSYEFRLTRAQFSVILSKLKQVKPELNIQKD